MEREGHSPGQGWGWENQEAKRLRKKPREGFVAGSASLGKKAPCCETERQACVIPDDSPRLGRAEGRDQGTPQRQLAGPMQPLGSVSLLCLQIISPLAHNYYIMGIIA